MAPFVLNLPVSDLMQAIDDSFDHTESQTAVTNVSFNALLENIVTELALDHFVEIAVADEFLNDLALELIVSLLDGILDEV